MKALRERASRSRGRSARRLHLSRWERIEQHGSRLRTSCLFFGSPPSQGDSPGISKEALFVVLMVKRGISEEQLGNVEEGRVMYGWVPCRCLGGSADRLGFSLWPLFSPISLPRWWHHRMACVCGRRNGLTVFSKLFCKRKRRKKRMYIARAGCVVVGHCQRQNLAKF